MLNWLGWRRPNPFFAENVFLEKRFFDNQTLEVTYPENIFHYPKHTI